MNTDILVVGGGPAGSSLALALGLAGYQVCLADASGHTPVLPDSGHDLRVSAVNRASQAFLQSLGAWQRMPAQRLAPFERMHVWDGTGRGAISFDAADIGTDVLGHIVENACMQQAIDAALAGLAGVEQRRGARLEWLQADADGVTARFGDGRLRARLLVGADGARSTVRELAAVPTSARSYEQVAVVCNLRMSEGHASTAWQRFMPTGPLAVLPLPGDYASIVWSTTPEQAAELLALPAEAFNRAVAEAFGRRLGEVVWSSARASFPLQRVQAQSYVARRVMLVGDAAHTIHPLAGQGLNLGLMDVAAAAELLAAARQADRDPGGLALLRRYERWRKTHNVAVQSAMDGLRWLFGHPAPALRVARNLGLGAAHAATPVKHLLARLASGLTGDLPASARV